MEKRQKLLHVRTKCIHDVFITDACIYDERKRRKRRKTAVTVRGDSRRGMGQPKYHIFFSLSFYYGITLSFNVKFALFTLSRLYLTPPICSEDRAVWKFPLMKHENLMKSERLCVGKSSKQINGCDLREMSVGWWQMGRKRTRYWYTTHTTLNITDWTLNIF